MLLQYPVELITFSCYVFKVALEAIHISAIGCGICYTSVDFSLADSMARICLIVKVYYATTDLCLWQLQTISRMSELDLGGFYRIYPDPD